MRHAIATRETIPGSRLEIFEGVGHYPHCEAPDRFVDVLVDFITSTAPAQVSERGWRELFQRADTPRSLPVRAPPHPA
jgi:hypothetical protein